MAEPHYEDGDYPGQTDWREIVQKFKEQCPDDFRMELVGDDAAAYVYAHNGGLHQGHLIDARLEGMTNKVEKKQTQFGSRLCSSLNVQELLTLLRRLYEVWDSDPDESVGRTEEIQEASYNLRSVILQSLDIEEI